MEALRSHTHLGIHQELAVQLLLSGVGVPSEEHAGARGVPHVAEHHALHVHGGASEAGDLVDAPVLLCPRALPRVEHGQHCQLQLPLGVCAAGSFSVSGRWVTEGYAWKYGTHTHLRGMALP
jgi:hypothetical protein